MPQWGSQDYKDAVFSDLAQGSGGDDVDHAEHWDNLAGNAPREHVEAGLGEAFHPDRLPAERVEPQFRQAAERMNPNERAAIAQDLLGQLQQKGVAPSWLQKMLGLGSHDAGQASPDDVAKLSEYARQNHPEVFQKVMADKPWLVRMMDKPLVAALVGVIAGKLMNKAYDRGS